MTEVIEKTICTHCGDDCQNENHHIEDKYFCCNGCKMVYTLLNENGLQNYYVFEDKPGISQKNEKNNSYDFLEEEDIQQKIITFKEGEYARVVLHLPDIHCSSCLFLLENLHRLNEGVSSSKVNFSKKEATIVYNHTTTTLKTLVQLLDKIGYAPHFSFDDLDEKSTKKSNKKLLYQLGLAGFGFGNIMLLSFPEYLGYHQASLKMYVGYINIALALPILLYAGKDYLISAYKGLRYNHLNIDVPVALGMITLFTRSVYEILSGTGEGYLDSLSGFIFFLLIGKWFQSATYSSLNFDRTYKSYFPISIPIKVNEKWVNQSLDKIEIGDTMLIKNQELIPTDGLIVNGKGSIDYSFVTGESDTVVKSVGEKILAGGKQVGSSIEVTCVSKVDESYLTQLWNENTFKETTESSASKLINGISKYFTYVILVIAILSLFYWYPKDPSTAFKVFTSVLIVACPCALALSIPFTYGNILRLLSKVGFHLKSIHTIEDIQDIDQIIFDKTGTLTDNHQMKCKYYGKELSAEQQSFIRSSTHHSSHPLSKAISEYLSDYPIVDIDEYTDLVGKGFRSKKGNQTLRVGSAAFIFGTQSEDSGVFIEIDGTYVGYFKFEHQLRRNIEPILENLDQDYTLHLLSGDTDREKMRFSKLFEEENIHFYQKPKDKLNYVQNLQESDHKVMMIGDGLNDAGALKQSQVGVVISDKVNNFSPSCDCIIQAKVFHKFKEFLAYAEYSKKTIYGAFLLAFLYNTIGMYFAITGNLSPVIAAILMPLSSISVIVYGVVMSYIGFRFYGLQSMESDK